MRPVLKISFPKLLDIVPIMFHMTSRWFWKEGSELLTYQICQNHVQRLRVGGEAPHTPGSRGLDPQALTTCAHWRPSNPRHENVRLCKSEPWKTARVKSTGIIGFPQVSAQIAAFQGWAPSRIHYIFSTTACWLEARTETVPPLSFHDPT